MEKRGAGGVRNPKIDCNAKITTSSDCGIVEAECTNLVADEAQLLQQPESACAGEGSHARVMLEGMVVHYLQADQPPNSWRKAQGVSNYNYASCKRDLSERTLDSKASIKQAENHKKEFREHQIEQWVSKHSYTQEILPRDPWLNGYPQLRGGAGGVGTAETSTSVQPYGSYQDMEIGKHVRQPQAFVKSHSTVEYVEPTKKQVRFVSGDTHINVSSHLEASNGVSLRKRTFAELKGETERDLSHESVGANQPYTGECSIQPRMNGSSDSEVTLRQWLGRSGRCVDCLESLNIFKQILQFVDVAHAQGVVLKNVRPSLFLLSSLHRVTFLDSASSSSSSGGSSEPSTGGAASGQALLLADTASKRDEGASHNLERNMSTLQRRSFEHNFHPALWRNDMDLEHALALPTENEILGDSLHFHPESAVREPEKAQILANTMDTCQSFSISNLEHKDIFPVRSTRLMEDMWYMSPEEAQDGTCSFASDVYSLGVLFFELFCPFSCWEEHSRLMKDLRHRILPPNLLSDRPKEAAFCLWLLHPDPTSRPLTRDILQSDILNDAVEALAERQDAISMEEKEGEAELLLDFLRRMQQQKEALVSRLSEELSCISSDIMEVKRRQPFTQRSCTTLDDHDPSSKITQEGASGGHWSSKTLASEGGEIREDTEFFHQGLVDLAKEIPVESTLYWGSNSKRKEEQIRSKSARMLSNFDKFEEAYSAMRWKVEPRPPVSQATQEASSGGSADVELNKTPQADTGSKQGKDSLGCFFDSLCKYARYSRFEVKATLLHGNLMNTSNMVCSLGFDRDQEYFATAGICKRIRVFDCDAVLNENVDIHYPVVEMMANSKLSSICWNSYIKSHIAASDYDGIVQLWDASTAQTLMQYKEHKKRAWSVDFSQADPTKLASGSDDGCVKLWSINQEGSIGTIKTEANVCCVQFPGDFAHLLAFGSADYKIYCYDLRNIRVPWCVLVNHTKAVSYIKFLDSDTIVSASTDNTLKLWDISRANVGGGVCRMPSLTFTGHMNEKNFVGLSVMDGYIACGSETNAAFAYHKSLPMPVASHKFGWLDPMTGKNMGDDTGKFVSSVCWRAKSPTLLAANSMGNVKLLEMV